MTSIRLSNACHALFLESRQPIQTKYEVQRTIALLLRDGRLGEHRIYRAATRSPDHDYRRVVSQLVGERRISHDKDFGRSVYRIHELPDGDAEELCCIADPFCYVSHLSAMEVFGITDRISRALMLTTLDRRRWRERAEDVIREDKRESGDILSGFSTLALHWPRFPAQVRDRPVARSTTRTPAKSVALRGRRVRVSAIGDTFLDMILTPELCGGIHHVLETWEGHACEYLDDIIAAVEATDIKIGKVRAGYILQERMGIQSPTVEGWKSAAQRGGSQRLDPTKAYAPRYSETWNLSVNI